MIAPERRTRGAGFPWLTGLACIGSVVVTLGFWFLGEGHQHQRAWGYLSSEEIWSGGYGALLTTTFIHAPLLQNPFHLLFNMVMLWRFGMVVELTLGHLEWLAFCVAAALVASGTELALFGSPGIGMSGVVYALFGLTWGARRTVPAYAIVANDETVRLLLGWMVLTFVLTVAGLWNIANGAHAGGLLFGLAVSWLLIEKPLPAPRRAAAGVVLVALVALTVLSVTYLPWSPRWRQWRDSNPVGPEAVAGRAARDAPLIRS